MATVSSFSSSTDVNVDFSEYNSIGLIILGTYSGSNYWHAIERIDVKDIELVRADTSHIADTIAPALSFVFTCYGGSGDKHSQLTMFLMPNGNVRFNKTASTNDIVEVKVYGYN